jgi:hypothetical protein
MATVGLSTFKPPQSGIKTSSTAEIKSKVQRQLDMKKLKQNPDSVLQISDKSKQLAKEMQAQKAKEATNTDTSELDFETSESVEAPDVAKDAPSEPDFEDLVEKKRDLDQAAELKKIAEDKAKWAKKPAIFFVSGFEWFGAEKILDRHDGLDDMVEGIKNAQKFAWDQKDEMIEQIQLREKEQPIILVGQGLGGDTVFEVAQELNSINNGFKKIDLLVTMNSSGVDNDFVPQNVKKNLNYLTSEWSITNDGPNIAANHNRTDVRNFLMKDDHSDLDNSIDVQMTILEEINKLV